MRNVQTLKHLNMYTRNNLRVTNRDLTSIHILKNSHKTYLKDKH